MSNKNKLKNKIKVGITIGDVNGINAELIIKTFSNNSIFDFCIPVLYGSTRVLSYYKKVLNITNFNYVRIYNCDELNVKKLNVINCWNEAIPIEIGKTTAKSGQYAIKALKRASNDLARNKIDVLVTLPVDKKSIQSSNFNFPGHTEYLAKLSNVDDALMFFISDILKIAVVTEHIPLKEVSKALNINKILQKIRLLNNSLKRDFLINKSKIAVLGLNPHSGDNGLTGKEEKEYIIPAIKKAREEDILCFGPYSPDGFWGKLQYKQFDAVLSMYHDQALIPFKLLAFDEGVNFTAGLPIVRTSPDHGPAFNIAGKNLASESSFRNAIFYACKIFINRKKYKEMYSNSLVLNKTNQLQETEK